MWEYEDRNGIRDRTVREHFEAVISAIDTKTLQRANRPQGGGGGKQEMPAEKPRKRRRRR